MAYIDLFKKSKRLPRKLRALLIAFLGSVIAILVMQTAAILWYRPIVIVRISEFTLNGAGAKKIEPGEQIENPELSAIAPSVNGSLQIGIKNIGRTPAQDISLVFLPGDCKLGKLYVKKSDPACALEITPPSQPQPGSGISPQGPNPQHNRYYHIGIKELGPGSQVQLKYTIYREGAGEPVFKFERISSGNAKVKAFYYRR